MCTLYKNIKTNVYFKEKKFFHKEIPTELNQEQVARLREFEISFAEYERRLYVQNDKS